MKFLNNCSTRYPNAATYRYYADKFLNGALTVASACGAVCALVFLLTL